MLSTILSTVLFAVPLILTIRYSLLSYSAVIGLSIITSLLYHSSHEKLYYKADLLSASLLMATNLIFVYRSGFRSPYFPLAIAVVAASLIFWRMAHHSRYHFYHSIWHICSVAITVLCIVAYHGSVSL